MCILVFTRSNGTPFEVTSIQEEDIIEISIQLGHAHPKGVICYSVIKSVMLFHSTDEMLAAPHGVIKATTLHEESIKVRTSPPSAAHVRAYMALMNREPSGTQLPTTNRKEEPQLSPSDPHLGGRTLHQLQVNLGNAELWKLMEDLCQEVELRELNTPPRDPPPAPWGNLVGNRNPSEDDQEVTFLRGGGWEPRGQPIWPPAPHSTRWRCGTSYKHTGHHFATCYPLY